MGGDAQLSSRIHDQPQATLQANLTALVPVYPLEPSGLKHASNQIHGSRTYGGATGLAPSRFCPWAPPRIDPSRLHFRRPMPKLGNRIATKGHRVIARGLLFDSVTEGALALLLEELVHGFLLLEGRTYQIPLGDGCRIDFRLGDVLIEFHNLRFRGSKGHNGDFDSHEQYENFRRERRRALPKPDLHQNLIQTTRQQLKLNYYNRRRRLVDQHSELRGCELVVATTWLEFYHSVLVRFGAAPLCTENEFKKLLGQRVKGLIKGHLR